MTAPASRAAPGGAPRTIVTFKLAGETFALGVEQVQEIIDPLPTTPVPCAPVFAPGIVNVRGSVVPVLDLHHRLGARGACADGTTTRMVVLDLQFEDGATRVAFLADSVEQVIELPANAIEPVPEIGIDLPPQHLDGVARIDGDLVVLLRTDSIFAHTERPVRAA